MSATSSLKLRCSHRWNLQQAISTSVVQLELCRASRRLRSIIWVHFIILFCGSVLDFAASYACRRIFFRDFPANLSSELWRGPQARFSSLLRHQCSQNAAAAFLLPLRRCSDQVTMTLMGKPGFHLIIIPTLGKRQRLGGRRSPPQGSRT